MTRGEQDRPRCHCGQEAAVVMSMETAVHGWEVGIWEVCQRHAWDALIAAGINPVAELIDFSDDPPEEDPTCAGGC